MFLIKTILVVLLLFIQDLTAKKTKREKMGKFKRERERERVEMWQQQDNKFGGWRKIIDNTFSV